jgi:hypothetical protein
VGIDSGLLPHKLDTMGSVWCNGELRGSSLYLARSRGYTSSTYMREWYSLPVFARTYGGRRTVRTPYAYRAALYSTYPYTHRKILTVIRNSYIEIKRNYPIKKFSALPGLARATCSPGGEAVPYAYEKVHCLISRTR